MILGTVEHPKTKHLQDLLRVPRYAAVGLLEMMWHFTVRYCPRGNIGRFTDDEIASALDWKKASATLIECLVLSRWLERNETFRLVVHDWHIHSPERNDTWLKNNDLTYWNDELPRRKSKTYRVLTCKSKLQHGFTPSSEAESDTEADSPKTPEGGGGDEFHGILISAPALRGLSWEQDLLARQCGGEWRKWFTVRIAEGLRDRAIMDDPAAAGAWLRRQFQKLAAAEARGVNWESCDLQVVLSPGFEKKERPPVDGEDVVRIGGGVG